MVSAQRPRSSVAPDHRSLPHPRLGGDAAADAGRPRAAEIPGVARQVSDVRGAGRRAGTGRHGEVAYARLQHPHATAARDFARDGLALQTLYEFWTYHVASVYRTSS